MLCDWHLDFLEDIINYSSIPKQLLLIQTIDQKRLMQFHILPCHEIGKAIRVEANQGIDFGPELRIFQEIQTNDVTGKTTSQWSRFTCKSACPIFISWAWIAPFSSSRIFPELFFLFWWKVMLYFAPISFLLSVFLVGCPIIFIDLKIWSCSTCYNELDYKNKLGE